MNVSLFHQLINLPWKLLCLLGIALIGWSVRIEAPGTKRIRCSIPLNGGNPLGVSSRNTSSNSRNMKHLTIRLRNMIVAVKLDSCTFYIKSRIWPFLDRIIMSMSLTPKTFNITSTFKLSFRFTFGTSRDINFSFWCFSSRRNNQPRPDSTVFNVDQPRNTSKDPLHVPNGPRQRHWMHWFWMFQLSQNWKVR
jgi:hypothetical protein